MKNFNLFKNVAYFSASMLLFFAGMVVYGVVLNIRHDTLSEEMKAKGIEKLENIKIVVDRTHYYLDLYSDTLLVKRYKAVFGKNNSTLKISYADFVTPKGKYKICDIDSVSQYHKLLKINYPNKGDAGEALKNGYIKKSDHDKIISAFIKNECPPDDTPLGSNIGIHGIGKYNFIFKNLPFIFNWTNGSIALSNENVDELYNVVKIGTTVVIKN